MLIQRGQRANFCSKYLLFISRMPKMCAIPQLVSAPLSPLIYCNNCRTFKEESPTMCKQLLTKYMSRKTTQRKRMR